MLEVVAGVFIFIIGALFGAVVVSVVQRIIDDLKKDEAELGLLAEDGVV